MDILINVIIIIVGLWLDYTGYQLIKYQKLEKVYDKSAYEDILPQNLQAYAIAMGKVYIFIGTILVISMILFLLEDIYMTIGQIILIISIIMTIVAIVMIHNKYAKKKD